MAYTPTNWVANTTVVSAAALNNIESGIVANEQAAAAAQTGADNAVKFSAAQSLTDAQKAQARGNIGAASAADVGTVPSGANLQGEVDDLKSAINEISESVDFAKVTDDLSVLNNGVTFTKESDNKFKYYGTATANRSQLFLNGQDDEMITSSAFQKTLEAGTYHIEATASGYKTTNWALVYTYTTFANGAYLARPSQLTAILTFTNPVMIGFQFVNGTDFGTSENASYITLNITKLSAKDIVSRDELNNLPLCKTPIVNTTVYLDNQITVGSYVLSGCTVYDLPYELASIGLPPHYMIIEKILGEGSVIWLKQTIGRRDLPYEYFRIYSGGYNSWQRTDGVIISTGDNTDRTTEINNLLSRYKYVKLGIGEFHVGKITIPVGCTLEGCGEKTVVVKIPDDNNVPTIFANSKVTIRDLTIKGTWTEQPTSETVVDKNRIGITVDGVVDPVIIERCRIIGFTYSGINVKDTGTSCKSVIISNCELIYNRVGINIVSSEFACITNVICRDNWIGCNNAGGNNKFTNCGFDSNGWGFIITDDANDGHGSCVACSFNHNTDRAISAQSINFGFVFSACQIHYGLVTIDNSSKGIIFVGCEFGSSVALAQYALYWPLFINSCVFYQDVREQTGYSAANIIYNDSYLFNGTLMTNN